jgi:cell division protein FtsB
MTNKQKIILVSGMVALFSFLFVIALGDRGAVDLYQLHLKKVRLNKATQEVEAKNGELYRVIQRLKDDPEFIEDIARKELGMVGQDELIYQFRKKEERIIE